MRDRLWIVIPAAGFPFLLVLFIVLWQSLQLQKRSLEDLVERLEGLEAAGQQSRNGTQELMEQQLSALQTRQQTLQRQISNLESWQRASGDRQRDLWNRLETPSPANQDPKPLAETELERVEPSLNP